MASTHPSTARIPGSCARGVCPARDFTALALLAGALLMLFAVPPHALARPEKAAQNVEERFNAMDADKDGKVSREEFFAAYPQMKEGAFAAIDTGQDDFISLEEWKTFAAGHSSADPHAGGEGRTGSMPPESMRSPHTTGNGTHNGAMPELIMPPRGKK